MLDGISLDQLKMFIAAVDEGSFYAASRKLGRAQSVVSDTIGNLEAQMGLRLFDRSTRYPALTSEGRALLVDARSVVTALDLMKARAKGIAEGLEPELSVVVDVLFPMSAITETAKAFLVRFPGTPLRLFVEALGAAHQRVLDGSASIGVVTLLPNAFGSLGSEHLSGVSLVTVAGRNHALASHAGAIPRARLAQHIQLVLSDRSSLSDGIEFAVMSPTVWRLADLFAKHAFLLDGLGWGAMPIHAVERDIAAGRLVVLLIEDAPAGSIVVPMSAIYPTACPPGPAGRWFIDQVKYRTSSTTATSDRALAR